MKTKSAPVLQVELLPTDKLIPYARNAKLHDEAQVAKIAGSIRAYGFNNPVLIDAENGIIAGHGRVLAALKLGLPDVPCIRLTHLNDIQRRAYMLADNRLAETGGGWDADMLAAELDELNAAGFDAGEIGFDEEFLASLIVPPPPDPADMDAEPQEDKAEELRQKWGIVRGQMWELGEHRLMCGDSTDKADVSFLLRGDTPGLMVTDPPYGVEYDANWRNERGTIQSDGSRKTGGGGRAVGRVENDDRADWAEAWKLFPGDVAYVWHASMTSSTVAESIERVGFNLRAMIVWNKNHFTIGRGDYHWKHELCWYAVRDGKAGHFADDRTQTTVWDIDKPLRSETGHSTQKPVECMEKPMRNHPSFEMVYEPFSGSGTTLIAAERQKRACRAMELNPGYVAVALQRWADATGKTPVPTETRSTATAASRPPAAPCRRPHSSE